MYERKLNNPIDLISGFDPVRASPRRGESEGEGVVEEDAGGGGRGRGGRRDGVGGREVVPAGTDVRGSARGSGEVAGRVAADSHGGLGGRDGGAGGGTTLEALQSIVDVVSGMNKKATRGLQRELQAMKAFRADYNRRMAARVRGEAGGEGTERVVEELEVWGCFVKLHLTVGNSVDAETLKVLREAVRSTHSPINVSAFRILSLSVLEEKADQMDDELLSSVLDVLKSSAPTDQRSQMAKAQCWWNLIRTLGVGCQDYFDSVIGDFLRMCFDSSDSKIFQSGLESLLTIAGGRIEEEGILDPLPTGCAILSESRSPALILMILGQVLLPVVSVGFVRYLKTRIVRTIPSRLPLSSWEWTLCQLEHWTQPKGGDAGDDDDDARETARDQLFERLSSLKEAAWDGGAEVGARDVWLRLVWSVAKTPAWRPGPALLEVLLDTRPHFWTAWSKGFKKR